jgi:broad specificity phosphatase PhoE
MLLYVIRHGQTDYNREERLQGARDIPLNDMGRSQARSNGQTLAATPLELPLDAFDWVSSPLSRTRETMELVRTAAGLDAGDLPDGQPADRIVLHVAQHLSAISSA